MLRTHSMNRLNNVITDNERIEGKEYLPLKEGNLFTGFFWGLLISIPLWLSMIGLGMIVIRVFGK